MDVDVFKAILAMDSYNRGYGEGIKNLGNVNTKIGNATFISQSNTDLNSSEFKSGFYASAYKLAIGETVISYRGSDSFFGDSVSGGSDVFNGYGVGAGFAGGPQATEAIDFYKAVAGTSGAALKTANISITGHSLGAGLGGYVAAIYGKSATIFDNMPFENAAKNPANDNSTPWSATA